MAEKCLSPSCRLLLVDDAVGVSEYHGHCSRCGLLHERVGEDWAVVGSLEVTLLRASSRRPKRFEDVVRVDFDGDWVSMKLESGVVDSAYGKTVPVLLKDVASIEPMMKRRAWQLPRMVRRPHGKP